MRLLCPNCRKPLESGSLTCANGHQFGYENGVLILLETEFEQRLKAFTAQVQRFRTDENKRLLDPTVYEDLPFAAAVRDNWEWRQRGYDVDHIVKLMGSRTNQTVLDIGASNGWLSHQLAKRGHQVTAVDYFVDPYDGLGAKQFYSTDFEAIQLDLTDLSVLDQTFDLVIINHGLHFFEDPIAHVCSAQAKLAPGGLMMLLGLQFYQDPGDRIKKITALQTDFRNRYQAALFLKPTKGYLTHREWAELTTIGIDLKSYPQLWRENVKAVFQKTAPRHYFGVYQAAANHA